MMSGFIGLICIVILALCAIIALTLFLISCWGKIRIFFWVYPDEVWVDRVPKKKEGPGYFCCRFEYHVNPDDLPGDVVFLYRTKDSTDES